MPLRQLPDRQFIATMIAPVASNNSTLDLTVCPFPVNETDKEHGHRVGPNNSATTARRVEYWGQLPPDAVGPTNAVTAIGRTNVMRAAEQQGITCRQHP